jgi:hypothetical protein
LSGKEYERGIILRGLKDIPIDRWDGLPQVLLGFLQSQPIDMTINAADFRYGRDSASHPSRTTSELIV